MKSKLDALKEMVGNNELPLQERQAAATRIVRLQVDSVPVPSADDAEVVTLQKPWQDRWLAELGAAITNGRSLTGYSVKDAVEEVHKRHRTRVVLAVIVDEAAHHLERLAACQSILDDSHPEGSWRRNNYSAERLLEHVVSPEGIDPCGRQWEPGKRPPKGIGDVWVV